MLFAIALLSCSPQQLTVAKEQLFTDWTTSSRIANITLGLPTQSETNSVKEFIDQIRTDIIQSTASELSRSERTLDVPFLMAMVDGIAMEYAPTHASSCETYLAQIGDELSGIAASRVCRMNYRASVLLGDENGAKEAKVQFLELDNPHPEDTSVFKLVEISEAYQEQNDARARALFDHQFTALVHQNAHYLLLPFANGYARIAPNNDEKMYGWFVLGDWLLDYGYDQQTIDSKLVSWISLLQNPPAVTIESTNRHIVELAMRRSIARGLQENSAETLNLLMSMAREGSGREAERVLEQGDTIHTTEALELLFQFPDGVQKPLEYWQLYAARFDYENNRVHEAISRITPIANMAGEYQQQALALLFAIEGTETSPLVEAFVIVDGIPERLQHPFQPKAIQELFQQCIRLCHIEGMDEWKKSALEILLKRKNGAAPSLVAESFRLVGKPADAVPFFEMAMQRDGATIQTTAGLADCKKDVDAMQRVIKSATHDDASSYWYWLANIRVLQWYVESGGNKTDAIAMVNRLRKKDASLGGAPFMAQFNNILD